MEDLLSIQEMVSELEEFFSTSEEEFNAINAVLCEYGRIENLKPVSHV